MDEFARHSNEDVCNLLQSVILKFCEEHYKSRGDVEVDAIICLSTSDSESQDVVKIHQVLQSGNIKHGPEISSSPINAKFNHSKKQNLSTKQHFFKRNSYLSRYPRKQYKPIHISNVDTETGDILTAASPEENVLDINSFQNTGKFEKEDMLDEIVEEVYGSNSSVGYITKSRKSRLKEEQDKNCIIPNQTAEPDFTSSVVSTIKREIVEPTDDIVTDTPNFSSRPKRKQNPKRIVRLHDSQNLFENDVTNLESESEEHFTSLIAKEDKEEHFTSLVATEDNMDQKQVMDDSGDTDEFQMAYGSSDFKPGFSYVDIEGDEDLTGGPESNHQDNIDTEINDSSSEHLETPPTRRRFKHKTRKFSQNLRQSECKVFQCSKCGSGFSSKKSQMRHERYNCGDIPHFECNVCGKFYSRADSKTRHLWKIHGIKISTPDKNSPMDFP